MHRDKVVSITLSTFKVLTDDELRFPNLCMKQELKQVNLITP